MSYLPDDQPAPKSNMAELRHEIGDVRSGLHTDMESLRSELHTEMRSLRSDLHAELREFRAEVREDQTVA